MEGELKKEGTIIRTIKNCGISWGVIIFVIIIAVICFCCSLSSSVAAMYYQRTALCASTCKTTEAFTNGAPCNYNPNYNPNAYPEGEEVTNTRQCNYNIYSEGEEFARTRPCIYNQNNDIIYGDNAYRTRDQIY